MRKLFEVVHVIFVVLTPYKNLDVVTQLAHFVLEYLKILDDVPQNENHKTERARKDDGYQSEAKQCDVVCVKPIQDGLKLGNHTRLHNIQKRDG